MKLLMLIVSDDKKEEVEVFLQRRGVTGFTELPNALGIGTTGPRLGSGAFPGTSAVILAVVEESDVAKLATELKAYCHDCGERLRMIAWSVENVL